MRVVWRLLLLGSFAFASVHGARPGRADPAAAPAPDKAKAKVAKQYVDAGLAAQSSGDYDTAITFYSKAFQLVPHPVLIFNMAQAHRLAGRMDQALRLYARYLEEDPGGAQAQTARDFLAEDAARKADAAKLAAARKADEARKADAVRKPDTARTSDPARNADAAHKPDEPRKVDPAKRTPDASGGAAPQDAAAPQDSAAPHTADVAAAPASSAVSQPSDDAPGRPLRLVGITVGTVGVAGLAVGIGFGIHGSSLSSEVSKRYDPAKVRAGDRANTLQAVGLIGGGVLVATGAVLYWRGHVRGHRAERLSLAPLFSDHLAGLALAGFLP